jgi:CRP-like cAMP-binding protein
MREIADLLDEVPALGGLEPAHRELIAGCGRILVARPGEYLFREGDRADTFYGIRRGSVALELRSPPRAPLVVETLHGGEVLGYSWLFPPYRIDFDARAVEEVHAIAFDGACLRGKCEDDHALGYELMRRFASVMAQRLQATRVRLLDVYGDVDG